MAVEVTRRVELEFDLQGTLVWHVGEGRPVSLVAEGELGFVSIQQQSSDQEGTAVVFTQTQRFAGTLKLTVEIE